MSDDVRKRLIIFFVVLVGGILFLLPTVGGEWFRDTTWISKPLSLGLDLSGGVHLKYRVQTKEAVKSRLQSSANAIKADLRKEKIPATRAVATDALKLEVTLLNERHVDRAKELIQEAYRELQFEEVRAGSGARVRLLYGLQEADINKIERDAVSQAVETLRNRVDQFGVAEPLIQKVGTKRILLQMPGISDIESVKEVVGKVAKLEFRLIPASQTATNVVTMKDLQGVPVKVEDVALMTGEAVAEARPGIINGQVEVALTLTTEGGRTFRRITAENVGRELAIILDGIVYSHPVIREPIGGGRASISGGFTMEEAHQLSVVLRAGALPAPLDVLEERTVGPTLGQESIEKGVMAIVIGFILVMFFMFIYYRRAGAVAVGTLVLNIVLVLAALSAFGATLTLPGLAGLALTVGMAVDANVIIFERIREELRNGSTRDAAVSAGFDKALSAIIDSNITTLLAGLILFYFGTGPIRGFAVTLSVGVLTTIYCATFVARLAFDTFSLKRGSTLSI